MEILFMILIWTFALYGLWECIKNMIYICTYTHLNSKGIYLIVAVKNQEETIECFLRTFLFRMIYGKEEIKNIAVVDLNSKDHTKHILEKLKKQYSEIHFVNWKECKELLENIKEN